MMREFYLKRKEDVSEVSGTGIVAQGVELPSGKVVLEWCTDTIASSQGIYDDIDQVILIHGHNGKTAVVWANERKQKETKEAPIHFTFLMGLIVGFILGIGISFMWT